MTKWEITAPRRPATIAAMPISLPRLSPNLRRGLAGAAFLAALAAAVWRMPPAPPVRFAPPAATALASAGLRGETLPVGDLPLATPTLTQLVDGRLVAAWLGGDGADAAIWLSRREAGGWRAPRRIVDRETTAAGSFARVDRLRSPLLYVEGAWLHLWYLGDLAGPALHATQSTDAGDNWRLPRRWSERRLPGLGGSALELADGGIALGLDELAPEAGGSWLRLAATGRLLERRGGPAQPRPAAFGRELLLPDGRRLFAASAAEAPALQLWLGSAATGWQPLRRLGECGGEPPALHLGRDGVVHLLCLTPDRRGLRHYAFGDAWLTEAAR